jgi:hypothetical protein
MGLSFLTPWGAVVAVAGAAPLAAFLWADRRAARIAAALRLPPPPSRTRAGVVVAVLALAAFVGAAAAEPVVDRTETTLARDDAEAWVVLDTSRSMLARQTPTGPTRLERAKSEAIRIRDALGGVRVGIASMTDRTLPHLFPSSDEEVFRRVVRSSLGIQRPPAAAGVLATRATTLDALVTVAERSFYSPRSRHRLLIVLSDFESAPFGDREIGHAFRSRQIRPIYVRIWHAGEKVYGHGSVPEAAYEPDPRSVVFAARLAAATAGRTFTDDRMPAVVAAARADLGTGPAVPHGQERGRYSLAPYAALAAVLPLGFLLWRRNL